MSNKVLIAYFSRKGENYFNGKFVNLSVGNTEVVAKIIETVASGTLFKINPVRNIRHNILPAQMKPKKNYKKNVRPELSTYLNNLTDYNTVILGYPNWWGTMPMPVWTFLDRYNFTDKTILPFCTHEGSGMGHSETDIKNLCPNAKVKEGLAIRGSYVKNAEKDIESWLGKTCNQF